jgi:hypothetical protein
MQWVPPPVVKNAYATCIIPLLCSVKHGSATGMVEKRKKGKTAGMVRGKKEGERGKEGGKG